MVLPLIPIALAGIGGGVIGGGIANIFGGGTKKDYGVREIHAPKEHYAPITTDARSISKVFAPTYQYQIESPYAEMRSKKDITARSRSDPDIAPRRIQEGAPGITTTEGVDMTKIAVIGVVGLVAYGLVSKK